MKSPSSASWKNIQAEMKTSRESTREWNLGRLGPDLDPIEQTLVLLDHLMPGVLDEASQRKAGEHPYAVGMLVGWALGRLVNAYELLLEGYLSDSALLLRAAWEAKWQLIAFDWEGQESADDVQRRSEAWLDGQWVGPRAVREMLPESKTIADYYSLLSSMAHPGNLRAIMLQIESNGTPEINLSLLSCRQPHLADVLLNVIWGELLDLLDFVPKAFPAAVDDSQQLAALHEQLVNQKAEFEARRLATSDAGKLEMEG